MFFTNCGKKKKKLCPQIITVYGPFNETVTDVLFIQEHIRCYTWWIHKAIMMTSSMCRANLERGEEQNWPAGWNPLVNSSINL